MKMINKLFVMALLGVLVSLAFASALTLPPQIVISASPNPAHLTSAITALGIDLSGSGISYVRIYEDGVKVKECQTSTCVYIAVHTSVGARSYYATTADNKGGTATSSVINVDFQNDAPVLNPIGNKVVNENSALVFTISGYDYNGDALTYSASGLPLSAGAVFSPNSRSFIWTPTFAQAGIYNVTFTLSDGSLSDSEIVQISVLNVPTDLVAPVWSSLTANPASGASYSPLQTYEFNSSWNDNLNSMDRVWINFNGVNYTVSGAGGVYHFSTTGLPAGTYAYEWFANDTEGNVNSTGSLAYSVNKAVPGLTINILPSNSVTNGTETNVAGLGCPSGLTCTLYRDGVAVSNPDIANLSVGIYNYVYSTTGNENYTSDSASATLSVGINKIVPALSISILPSNSVTSGTQTNVTGLGCPSELTCTLYRNGVAVSNSDIAALAAGTYTYVYNTTGNENYTSAIASATLGVNKIVPTLSISILPSNSVENGTETNVTGSGCPSGLTCTLYRNGIPIVGSNSNVETLAAGTYTYVYNTTGNENYTSAIASATLTVQNAESPESRIKTINTDDLIKGYYITMNLNDRLKFTFCGSPYYIKLTDLNYDDDKAAFSVIPGVNSFVLKEGSSEKIDLDSDSVSDILFRLENVNTDSARVYIKRISDLCGGGNKNVTSTISSVENVEKLLPKEKESNLVPIAGFLGVGILLCILLMILNSMGAFRRR
jgi:hypothetical protein